MTIDLSATLVRPLSATLVRPMEQPRLQQYEEPDSMLASERRQAARDFFRRARPEHAHTVFAPWASKHWRSRRLYLTDLAPARNQLARFVISVLFLAAAASAEAGPAASRVIYETDVNPRGNMLLAPVTIDGKAYRFMIDTGSNYCCFDESLRHLLGRTKEPVLTETASTVLSVDQFEAPAISLGPIVLRPVTAACMAMRTELVARGLDCHGIIGFDCLVDKVFVVNFDLGKLRFLDKPAPDAGERIPLEWTATKTRFLSCPFIVADLGSAGQERLLVDTGSCDFRSVSIRRSLFDHAIAVGGALREGPAEQTGWAVGGPLRVRTARLQRFSVGLNSHRGLLMTDGNRSKIGLWYLSRYIVTFDFPRKAMYLRPGKAFFKSDRYDLSGAVLFVSYDGKKTIGPIEPGSPAEKAGMRQWDELIQIDELIASRTNWFELCLRLSEPGKRRILFVRDERERLEGVLDLVDPTPPRAEPKALPKGCARAAPRFQRPRSTTGGDR